MSSPPPLPLHRLLSRHGPLPCRPGLVKGAWSMEEDENLVKLIGEGFSNWSELASHTPGRTAKQCRERWCHHLDPSVNHGNWTMEEDQQLKALQVPS